MNDLQKKFIEAAEDKLKFGVLNFSEQWKNRLVIEYLDLSTKIEKLKTYISTLTNIDRETAYLPDQLQAMEWYQGILFARIANNDEIAEWMRKELKI